MARYQRRLFFASIMLILLSAVGCTSLLPKQGAVITAEQQRKFDTRNNQLAAINTFYLSARLGLTANGDAWNGALRWEQNPDAYLINFNAALGQGALVLMGNHETVELKLADGSSETANNAESLLFSKTGMEFPISGLRYWVVGVPSPQSKRVDNLELDERGRITAMQQSDWDIRYQSYQHVEHAQLAAMELPRKILMKHDGVTIRLVIDRWEITD